MDFWWRSTCTWQAWLLLPFAWLYRTILACRRLAYRFNICHTYIAPVPVIVVGNFTVGGTGKTPLVITLTDYLQQQGLRVGIVSRGYGAKSRRFPVLVTASSDAALVGDEPLLMAKRTACPIMIDPNRSRAIQTLLKQTPCDVIVSDDGLQHLAMQPTISIVVIDGIRRFGNGLVLPAGPLREPIPPTCRPHDLFAGLSAASSKGTTLLCPSGLQEMSRRGDRLVTRNDRRSTRYIWVVNGEPQAPGEWPMQLQCDYVYPLEHVVAQVIAPNTTMQQSHKRLTDFAGQKVVAIAGIGNPQRFFTMLQTLGIEVESHAFPDHHAYTADDFKDINPTLPWLMTEKDAVKCNAFALTNAWVVSVNAALPPGFWRVLQEAITSADFPAVSLRA